MSQEATMIVIDNSSYMKNGDFIPDRFYAQKEALNFLCNTKKRQNPENSFGLVTLCNSKVLCTLSMDSGKVYNKICTLESEGEPNFSVAVAIAHLVLRNRMFRNQKPRIVVFLGSPVIESDEELTKIAKRLKKEKIGITIINFGETEINEKRLTQFVETINGKDESGGLGIMLTVPSGLGIQEYLRVSPVIMVNDDNTLLSGGNLGLGSGGSGTGGGYTGLGPGTAESGLGLDDEDDPDLAYALRVSLEEQRSNLQAREPIPNESTMIAEQKTAEETLLNEVIEDNQKTSKTGTSSNLNPSIPFEAMTEDEQIAFALNMSMNTQMPDRKSADNKSDSSEPLSKQPRK